MSQALRMWIEIVFDVSYLVVVWGFVIAMWQRRASVQPQARSVARLFMWAFVLLALGDTGHVGFRVWAYARGGLDTQVALWGASFRLIGLGSLATAVTVTVFYMLALLIWQKRFDKPLGWFGLLLLAAGVVRLAVMAFPQNHWANGVAPTSWSLGRNALLILQGLGVAGLILRDALAAQDRTFQWVGYMILVSYAFYIPVILFARQVPVLGMLMMPKTVAYVVIAWLGFANLFSLQWSESKPIRAS